MYIRGFERDTRAFETLGALFFYLLLTVLLLNVMQNRCPAFTRQDRAINVGTDRPIRDINASSLSLMCEESILSKVHSSS